MNTEVRARWAGWREPLLAFIQREGPVATNSVAYRFGWEISTARKLLKALERKGEIKSERRAYAYCAMLTWRAVEERKP